METTYVYGGDLFSVAIASALLDEDEWLATVWTSPRTRNRMMIRNLRRIGKWGFGNTTGPAQNDTPLGSPTYSTYKVCASMLISLTTTAALSVYVNPIYDSRFLGQVPHARHRTKMDGRPNTTL